VEGARKAGWTLREIERETGIPFASLADFAASRGGMTIDNAGKLAGLFGMRLTDPELPNRD
jgi:hypothetical protein